MATNEALPPPRIRGMRSPLIADAPAEKSAPNLVPALLGAALLTLAGVGCLAADRADLSPWLVAECAAFGAALAVLLAAGWQILSRKGGAR